MTITQSVLFRTLLKIQTNQKVPHYKPDVKNRSLLTQSLYSGTNTSRKINTFDAIVTKLEIPLFNFNYTDIESRNMHQHKRNRPIEVNFNIIDFQKLKTEKESQSLQHKQTFSFFSNSNRQKYLFYFILTIK